jgi:hypothetical protein
MAHAFSIRDWMPSLGRREMNTLLRLVCFAMLCYGSVAEAQTQRDEKEVSHLPQAMCDAWNRHDGHELAKMMAEDVDFVTVGASSDAESPISF